MKKIALGASLLTSLAALFAFVGFPATASTKTALEANLKGFNEVPAVSTTGKGAFEATIKGKKVSYELTYSDLKAKATAAHVHFGQPGVSGGVIAFLCGGGDKPKCPPGKKKGTVKGTIDKADIVGPAAQGIEPQAFNDAVRVVKKGLSYVNVHSGKFPEGEIRGQIEKAKG